PTVRRTTCGLGRARKSCGLPRGARPGGLFARVRRQSRHDDGGGRPRSGRTRSPQVAGMTGANGALASQAVDVRITDSTLRDGSHAMAHRFTEEQVRATVAALDDAGIPVIEVSHG